MADLKISALNSLAGADLVAADVVAVVDDSASETKKLTVSDLIANGSTLISDNTIPSAKILFSAGAIDTAELAASSVETAKINDSAVTAAKLADNSSVTLVSTLPASGDFTGQIALDTDDNKIYIWDGSAWDSVKGAGSINVVNGSTTGEINIVASTSGDTVTISATLDDTSAAAQFLGGPTGAGGTVGYRALVGTDLPTATTSAKGGVIVNGNGLTMSGDTITIDNTVTAETTDHHIVKYDANGLVTAGRAIAAGDLPVATSSATGAVKPGAGLGVDAAGEISHSNSITGATAAKVTFDAQGHITATEALAASDIPDLDTAKITTGTFPEARIGSAAVSGAKLKDYAVAQISETTPTAEFTSQFFFNPITRDLFLWDGNVFQPVGISAGEIVLAGTYDASTNLLDSVTADGTAAGFTNGASLPSAAAGNNRHYVVVSQSGTGSAPAPTVTLEPPDILLSNGTSYVLIETSETITAQIASNVGFTATGNITATNVQAAVAEVDSEKVAKAGDTMTGNLNLGEDVVLTFEGATDNAFETTLTVVDPTADRSLALPNVSGTLVSSGDTGTVTSTMIADGTIANADISASAEIAVSKLGNGSARQVLQTDSLGTGVEFTDDLDLPGTLDVTGAATLDSTLGVTGLISADGKVKFPAGSASAPSFYSGTDTNTGLYFSAADEISVATGGTQRVVVDASGEVGIGVASPQTGLHISDGSSLAAPQNTGAGRLTVQNSSSADIQLMSANTGYNHIFFGDQDDANVGVINYVHNSGTNAMTFATNAAERMRLDSSGRLLVGTSSSRATHGGGEAQFQIEGTNTATAGVSVTRTDNGSGSATFSFGKTRNGSVVQSGDSLGTIYWQADDGTDLATAACSISGAVDGTPGSNDMPGRLVFSTTADGTSSPTERMRIDSSGKVGIGTTSPGTRLHVNGTTPIMRVSNGTTQIVELKADSSASILRTTTNHPLLFGTNDTERLRIDSSGRLLVGTSSGNDSSAQSNLVIESNSSGGTSYGGLMLRRGSTSISSGTSLGRMFFADQNGKVGARISGLGDGTWATNDYPGVITFDTTADGASSPTERMRIDSNGYVDFQTGILGDNPSDNFTLNGRTQPHYGFNLVPETGVPIGISGYRGIAFATNGAERMRIESGGDVGIGITNPTQALHVKSSSSTQYSAIAVDTSNAIGGGVFDAMQNGTRKGVFGVSGWLKSNTDDDPMIYTVGGKNLRFYIGGSTERMRIDTSGNVGIGTTSPANTLHLADEYPTIRLQSDTGSYQGRNTVGAYQNLFSIDCDNDNAIANSVITFNIDGSERARIDNYGDATFASNPYSSESYGVKLEGLGRISVRRAGATDITFASYPATGTTPNVTIKGNGSATFAGNVGIGTTSPGSELHLAAGDTNCAFKITNTSGGSGGLIQQNGSDFNFNNLDSGNMRLYTADTERMRIDSNGMARVRGTDASGALNVYSSQSASTSNNLILGQHSASSITSGTLSFLVYTNGNVVNTNNSYGSLSDAKLKENIVDASSQWDDIKDLRVRNYNFIEGQTHTQIGVVAQEVETVSPGLVTESPDRDEDGNDLGTVTKSVNYSVLYMKAVKALQEAMDRIETLEAKVAALEAE